MFDTLKEENLEGLDYSYLSEVPSDFTVRPGREHFRLLSYLTTKYDNATITYIGPCIYAIKALSYNKTATLQLFTGVNGEVDREEWNAKLLKSSFIFLQADSDNGTMYMEFYEYMKKLDYKGYIICNNIWACKAMRDDFWYRIPYEERYDLSDLGHWSGTGVISFSKDIRFPKRDNSNWTLFTAYFNLTKCVDASEEIRKRDQTHYMQNAVSTMALPYNLVVYCDEGSYDILYSMRPPFLRNATRYVIRDFETLATKDGQTFRHLRERIHHNRRLKPYFFDNRNTASYYLFCLSRYILMKEVIEENSFQSTHFCWINVCIERMGYKNVQRLDEALAVRRKKFSTCYIDYIPESLVKNLPEYFQWGRCSMCSGFFTGNSQYMYVACDLIEEKFLELLDKGYGHADEQLYSPVFFENRGIFEHYYGDYTQMITNYTYIYEAAEAPIYNFIRNSYANGEYEKCKEACTFVIRSLELGKCECNPQLKEELYLLFSRL